MTSRGWATTVLTWGSWPAAGRPAAVESRTERQRRRRWRPARTGRDCQADIGKREALMQALVYHGPKQKSWDTVPEPTVQAPTDAIVRIDTTTICGTDLHI